MGREHYLMRSRREFVQQFKSIGKAEEFRERHYYKPVAEVKASKFWLALVSHCLEHKQVKNFLSADYLYLNGSLTELVAGLTFSDLPSRCAQHVSLAQEAGPAKIKVRSALLSFAKEIQHSELAQEEDAVLLIVQRFFNMYDRYYFSDESPEIQHEKPIQEYVVNKVYGC